MVSGGRGAPPALPPVHHPAHPPGGGERGVHCSRARISTPSPTLARPPAVGWTVSVPVPETVPVSVPVSVTVIGVRAPLPVIPSGAATGRDVEGSPERSRHPGHPNTLHGRVVAEQVSRWDRRERREEEGSSLEPLLPASPAIPARDSLGANPAVPVAVPVTGSVTMAGTVAVSVAREGGTTSHPPARDGDAVSGADRDTDPAPVSDTATDAVTDTDTGTATAPVSDPDPDRDSGTASVSDTATVTVPVTDTVTATAPVPGTDADTSTNSVPGTGWGGGAPDTVTVLPLSSRPSERSERAEGSPPPVDGAGREGRGFAGEIPRLRGLRPLRSG